MRIRIKLCGMTRPEDAALASSLGADAVGMIFYRKSARNVSLGRAREIISQLNPMCSPVAVVVNPDVVFVDELIAQLDIQLIQFHGDEPPEFCAQFALPYIKAVRMRQGVSLGEVRRRYADARALLLDSFDKTLVGGTGQTFDWRMAVDEAHGSNQPELILAGGIGPENAAAAVQQTGIRTLDVNSGIESAPGIKHHARMREIIQVAQALSSPPASE